MNKHDINIYHLGESLDELLKIFDNYSLENSIPTIIRISEQSSDPKTAFKLLSEKEEEFIESPLVIPYIKYLIRIKLTDHALRVIEGTSLKKDLLTILKSIALKHQNKKLTDDIKHLIKARKNTNSIIFFDDIERKKITTSSLENKKNIEIWKKEETLQPYAIYLESKILFEDEKYSAAIEHILLAIEIAPCSPLLWGEIAILFSKTGQYDAAFDALMEAITYDPNNTEVMQTLLDVCYEQSRLSVAERYIKNLANTKTKNILLKGILYKKYENPKAALAFFSKVLKKNPKHPVALPGKIMCSAAIKESADVLSSYKIWQNNYDKNFSDLHLLNLGLEAAMHCLDWNFVESNKHFLFRRIRDSKACNSLSLTFYMLALTDDFRLHGETSYKTSLNYFSIQDKEINKNQESVKKDKIRVGYISGDIGSHIVTWLLSSFIDRFDQEKFEIYLYSYKYDLPQEVGEILSENIAGLYRLENFSDKQCAEIIKSHSIDILVDLTVYTSNTRSKILTHHPANIQIAHMGYPSTSGCSDVYDYMVVDKHKISNIEKDVFHEKLIIMPEISGIIPFEFRPSEKRSKHSYGLPEDAFIFACFNQPFKYNKHIFSLWMEILKRVEKSIIWLYAPEEIQRKNITTFLTSSGIDSERVIFAPSMGIHEHLQRLQCADLILDTFPYGNHSSGAFALLSGAPLLAYKGSSYVSSISASFLSCIGTPQMIAFNDQQYIDIAVRFATDSQFREEVCSIVRQSSERPSPLFDAARYITHYQAALELVYTRYREGLSPEDIQVPLLFEPYCENNS